MAVIQLSGGSTRAPQGALNIRLSRPQGVTLELVGPDGAVLEPNFRVTPTEVVVVPAGPVTVVARAAGQQTFLEGTRIGVSVRSASGQGDEVVRPPSEVGGRPVVSLVEITGGEVVDLVGRAAAAELGWMQRGNYAYHVHHTQGAGRHTPWALVVDGSASRHRSVVPEHYHAFLELVLGICAAAHGGAPEAWLLATQPVRDVTPALAGETIDWAQALDHPPAPWPSLGGAVGEALDRLPGDGAVVLVADGVFVDYREVREQLQGRTATVVALGRSRHGARPEDRPAQFWEEELAGLEGYDHVVSLASLAGLAEDPTPLADALFPWSVR
ncbi:hypothetical protein [uncultured Tessaracoccus sp.]|uniref:hypothetical protein n=1 Tax=uncultured Tessaracoccus sp. TaxID=905023 RepID=UPI0025E3010F|nr:hypothetical protein [uncultured Tessaracoccus sp.]